MRPSREVADKAEHYAAVQWLSESFEIRKNNLIGNPYGNDIISIKWDHHPHCPCEDPEPPYTAPSVIWEGAYTAAWEWGTEMRTYMLWIAGFDATLVPIPRWVA